MPPKPSNGKSVSIPETASSAAGATSTPDGARAERLTLPLTSSGKIDWEKIRPERRRVLKDMLASSGVQPAVASHPGPAPSPIVNAALCGTIYDLLAQVEALAAARMFGCPADHAFAALKFSADEKAALADPTARVINKYLPAALLERYADECMLLLLLVTMTKTKLEHLQDSLRRHTAPASVKSETVKTS